MLGRRISVAAAALVLNGAAAARADNLALFHVAVEDVEAHNRAAIGALQDKNFDRAALAIERMKESWSAFAERFSGDRPDKLRDSKLYVQMLVDVPTRLVTATIMINFGKPEIAKSALEAIRQEFSNLRRDGGVEVLADCVLDVRAATTAVSAFADHPPDWSKPETGADIIAKTEALRATVKRCDGMAPAQVHDNTEFRQLVDGLTTALALVPEAAMARDDAALHRIVAALRALGDTLTLRYG
ncbi:MAG TPA: hypothetical protein VLX44_06885 [Xanthobacteraceae bacterium]|nr:hypothetical protein [Xanthobacteraceae bacterium]